jgi:isopentenyl-diphosphate delta-isomerase
MSRSSWRHAASAVNASSVDERDRKAEHIQLALEQRMQHRHSFFDGYSFEHVALPELNLDDIDTSTSFLGRRLSAPLLISCMTGGTAQAGRINRNLAAAAEAMGVAVGVGSQRRALEDPSQEDTFRIRELAPSVPILANLGAVQLNYGLGTADCRRSVEMIEADALVLHLNPLQEAIQPEGQCDFSALLDKIGAVASELEVPIIVKEVGCGISRRMALQLAERGIAIVDTAGLGGTSWARIEAARADNDELGETFASWGIPTPEAIRRLRGIPGLTIIGSGGIRNGVDVGKALALGANLAGLAYPFLQAATESAERVVETIRRAVRELKISMFCVGAANLSELASVRLVPPGGHDDS